MSTLFGDTQILVYSCDLRLPPTAGVGAKVPVAFQVNSREAHALLSAADARFEMSKSDVADFAKQTQEGEVCVSGWVGSDLVSYAWIQFRQRQLAGSTVLPIGPKRAFIHRYCTIKERRNKGVHTAALLYCQMWLRARSYERVFIDVDSTNRPARKAIDRAGFELLSSYRVKTLLGRRSATFPEALKQALVDDRGLHHG
jgi:RimJ/RimL family protein N-acetyltransferase